MREKKEKLTNHYFKKKILKSRLQLLKIRKFEIQNYINAYWLTNLNLDYNLHNDHGAKYSYTFDKVIKKDVD